jgi:hypothetical protein
MAKMSYQKAEYVRGSGLSKLIEQNMQSGKGFLKSTGGAIGSKLKASATGIQEKFDPLNFFKFISGGNPLAFRLLGGRAFGRLTGRSEEDVDYFAGGPGSHKKYGGKKNKKTAQPLNTSISSGKKITPVVAGDNVADGIAKIYTLLKNSYDDKIKKSELQKNFEEGKREKEEKRHKELIEALKGIVHGGGDGGDHQDKNKKKWYEVVFDVLEDAWGKIAKFASGVMKMIGEVIGKVKDFAVKAWSKIKSVARDVYEVVMGKVKAIIESITDTIKTVFPKASEKITKFVDTVIEGGKDLFKVGAKEEVKVAEKGVEKVAEKTVGKSLLKKIPILGLGAGLFFGAQRALAGDWLGAGLEVASGAASSIPVVGTAASAAIDVGLAARDVMGGDEGGETPNVPTQTTTTQSAPSSAVTLPSTGAGGGRGSINPPTASAMPSVNPSGEKMVSSTQQNIEALHEESMGSSAVVVNKTSSITTAPGRAQTGVVGETVVRNDEDSFLRTIRQSMRLV